MQAHLFLCLVAELAGVGFDEGCGFKIGRSQVGQSRRPDNPGGGGFQDLATVQGGVFAGHVATLTENFPDWDVENERES